MADNAQTAKEVLAAVGGKENVTNLIHCITRLRFSLKDESIPVVDDIKKIPGVIGAQWSGGQFQVIIGQNVTKVYDETLKLGVGGGGSIDVNEGDAKKFEWTPKNVGNAILNYLSKSMVALIPLMMACAMFRTIASVMGPTMLGIWAEDSEIYNLFNNWLYNAGFYFLPIILGWSAAKQLGCSQVLGMMMGGVLLAPELQEIVASAAETGITTMSIYGIPAPVASYATTVLPIMLCMPVLAQVEKFFKKVLPDVLSTVFEPFLTMLVMVPVALCALAPIGSWLGDIIGNFMFALGNSGGVVTVLAIALIAASWEFLVMTGMHQVLITLGIAALAQNGFDTCVFIGGMTASAACWGMSLGAFLRLHERDERSTMLGFFISGLIGGITEPTLYGCGFKYPRTFIGLAAGGFVGGVIAAIAGVKVYVIGNASILSLIAAYAAGGTTNLVMGAGAGIIAAIVAAAMVYFFGFTKEQLDEDREAANAA
jgi:PTS system beta-glucosides-specific IIC component